ncbi:hypothetical protein [Microlunatus sp. Gsoil 973]|uniref:hypothetical protein n=1 Tax=Microlunatus sp. Gsoil 973 TaxID=2672569 RepID=UPI0012B446D2|nr:hypothetical protein [Microlunatus sp. Gsoil 973]QGN34992.1 hypothetical protein GJV80_21610 [Microlunatus sp. Gsoil 973]
MSLVTSIPSVLDGMVVRPRLLERLHAGSGLTVIHAPFGYGKTTLAAQWAARTDRECLWVSFGAELRTGAQLWDRLVTELVASGWSDSATLPGTHRDRTMPAESALKDRVVRALHRSVDRRTMIFDNAELIGPDAADELDAALDLLREVIDCVVLTRDREYPVPKHPRREITVFGPEDLLLTDCELAAVLQPLTGLAPEHELAALVGRLPLAAHTAAVAYRQTAEIFDRSTDRASLQLSWIRSTLAGMCRESFVTDPGAPPATAGCAARDDRFGELSDFLAVISVAHTVEPSLAAELSGSAVTRARYLLVRAVQAGFGRWEPGGADGVLVFRYAPGIRQSLHDQFGRADPAGFRLAHQRLAVWAETHDDWVAAVEAWLQISDLHAANRGIGSHLDDLIQSRGAEIRRLVVPTEPVRLRRYPFLALAAAIVSLGRTGEPTGTAEELLSLAVAAAREQKPRATPTERMLLTAVESAAPWLRGESCTEIRSAHGSVVGDAHRMRLSDLSGQLPTSAVEAVQQTLATLFRATAIRTAEDILGESDLIPGRTGRPDLDFQLSSMTAAIGALSGDINTARQGLQHIEQRWPQSWQDGPLGRFHRLARVVVAVESLEFDQAVTEIERAENDPGELPLYWGIYQALSLLAPNQPEVAYDQLTRVARDRTGSPLTPNERNVLDGWRYLALRCQGENRQAETLIGSMESRPWPKLLDSVWALADGRPQHTLDLLEQISTQLRSAPDTIFERLWPGNSAGLRAAAYLRLGRSRLALAELERMTGQIAATGRRTPLVYVPSQDLSDLLDLARDADRDQPAKIIGDVSRLPDPVGRRR